MIANVVETTPATPTAPTAYAVTWIDAGHLAELIDAWARETHANGGAYDPAAHALLADMALECDELDRGAVLAELVGDGATARDGRRLANAVSLDALRILNGLRDGHSLDDLAAG